MTNPTTPTVYNVPMDVANTEYSQALPTGTKKFTIKLRDSTAFRLAYETGKVYSPASKYLVINDGFGYSEENIEVTALTLYFASAVNTKIAEIVAWV